MDFQETLTIALPDVEEQLSAFAESDYRKEHGLIVEVAAIHEGMTANYNFYSSDALEGALNSWVSPYPKPIIMNHDPSSEPIGRVMAAKMDQEADGTPYTKLQVAITDPEAITKVLDKRYLTGSVGGKAQEATCSVCGADWANASFMNLPCRHQRGKTYKGKMAYLEMKDISFKEYSIVNMPADQRSNVRAIVTANEEEEGVIADDERVREARVFDLDMSNERILEFSESANVDVLQGLRKKEASPKYLQLKGAFLSALAVAEYEKDDEEDPKFTWEVTKKGPYGKVNYADPGYQKDGKPRYPLDTADHVRAAWSYINQGSNASKYTSEQLKKIKSRIRAAAKKFGIKLSEESDVTVDNLTPEEDEDILAVAEGLSDDLAAASEEEDESTDETPAEEGGDKPEGQETPSGDVDPDTSAGAPKSREDDDEDDTDDEDEEDDARASDSDSDEEEEEDEDREELSDADEEDESAEEEEENDDEEPEESNTDLDDAIKALESRVEELEASERSLLEKNTRLQMALKRNLAERVVDTKIALGLEEGDRDELLTEHMTRNASSLADSLRDMAKMSPVRPTEMSPPVVEERSGAVDDGEPVVTEGESEGADEEQDPVSVAEQVFTDVLMGRRQL